MVDHEDVASYSARKEAFVSNLTGTSKEELVLTSIPLPLGLWLLAEIKALSIQFGVRGVRRTSLWEEFVMETIVLVLPCLLSVLWPSCTMALLLLMIAAGVGCRFKRRPETKVSRGVISADPDERLASTRKSSDSYSSLLLDPVTSFRASVMLLTCISILGVDFQVFPRRFAKTETFGTGLMDLGVGTTIFASGLASGNRRRRKQDARLTFSAWRTVLSDVVSTGVRAWPLAALGVSRLIVHKGLAYQEHVSEYGVHWNFFVTLFCVRLVVSATYRWRPARWRLASALALLGAYQGLLCIGGLADYMLTAPRTTLFSMNREGVLGVIGFVAIYFIAEELGSHARAQAPRDNKEDDHEARPQMMSLVTSSSATLILWGLTSFSEAFVQSTSRRMVNMTYVLWVSAHSSFVFTLLVMVATYGSSAQASRLMAAINLNMFAVFMVANLMTGAVNILVRTLDCGNAKAVAILLTYIVFVAGFAIILAERSIVFRV